MSRSLGVRSFTTSPPIETVPSVISSSPATMRSAVVLPQPEGPTRTRNSPSRASSVRSMTACTPPSYVLPTSSNVTSATSPLLPSSTLDRAARQALDDEPLQGEEQQRRRDRRQEHARGERPPLLRVLLRDEPAQADD